MTNEYLGESTIRYNDEKKVEFMIIFYLSELESLTAVARRDRVTSTSLSPRSILAPMVRPEEQKNVPQIMTNQISINKYVIKYGAKSRLLRQS